MIRIEIKAYTTAVKTLLKGKGTVVGIYDKCFNIKTEYEEMITVFHKTDRITTRGMISAFNKSISDLPLSAGETVIIEDQKIKLTNIEFDYSNACLIETYRQSMVDINLKQEPFLKLKDILKYTPNFSPLVIKESLVYKKFMEGKRYLESDYEKGFENLIGLGIGLTPSADDFLSGMTAFFGLINYASQFIKSLKQYLLKNGKSRTSFVSYNLISDVCNGHIGDDLYELIFSLAYGKSDIEIKVNRMLEYGSSSGYETCLGILAGYEYYRNGVLEYGSN